MNELIVKSRPKSGISEAIKTIRTNLQFSSIDEQVKTILVTSSIPGEGKSFITANLAVAFAQNGNRVLIVDCDMRRGRQNKVFNVSNDIGLSNLLIHDVEKYYLQVIQPTNIENLDILPSGVVPPNPSELLDSDKNKKLIEILKEKYDYILFDGVPANGLTDSIIMAELVDKIVIVCALKQTPSELLIKTKKVLEKFESKIAGVVVNKVPLQNNSYYTKYYT